MSSWPTPTVPIADRARGRCAASQTAGLFAIRSTSDTRPGPLKFLLFMLSARGEGLHTCPQVAFANYHRIIRRHVPIPEEVIVVCGMAVGYRDPDAPENIWRTNREKEFFIYYWQNTLAASNEMDLPNAEKIEIHPFKLIPRY